MLERAWGDDTKVVDDEGRLLTVYHGTDAPEIGEFVSDIVWFAENPEVASRYAHERRSGMHPSRPNVIPSMLHVANPVVLAFDMNDPAEAAIESLVAMGWDTRVFTGYASGAYEIVRSFEFAREAQRRGYDGVRVRERGEWTWGVFDDRQIRSVFQQDPPARPAERRSRRRVDHFAEWAKGHRLVPVGSITPNFRAGEGVVVEAFHGTRGDFEVFDANKADPEANLGAGFYFSNTAEDVEHNYAGFGPDIAYKFERLRDEASWEVSNEGLSLSDTEFEAEVDRRVSERMGAHDGMTMRVYVRFDNPLVIGAYHQTVFTAESLDEDLAKGRVSMDRFFRALTELEEDGEFSNIKAREAWGWFKEMFGDTGVNASDLVPKLLSQFAEVENASGVIAPGDAVRRAAEKCGFDGIIDMTVDSKFGSGSRGLSMEGMDASTVHFIAFEPTQIKSAIGNRGTYDQSSPNILHSDASAERGDGDGTPSKPFDFSKDARFHHIFYGNPTPQQVADFSSWLRARPNAFVRLYHGAPAGLNIEDEGLLPTSLSRRNSLQSTSGFVYLSAYPGMAYDFGHFASLNRAPAADGARVAVYPVTITLRRLLADLDQLANRRKFAQEQVGNSLAESLIRARGARVRGRVEPQCLGAALRFAQRDVLVERDEQEMVRYSFAGPRAKTADLAALDRAKARHGVIAPDVVRVGTGWFKGVDGRWRFEIDDSGARLLPSMATLRLGYQKARPVVATVYRRHDDGTFDLSLNPSNPQQLSDFVSLTGVRREVLEAVLPSDVLLAIDNGDGEEDFMGALEEAARIERPFHFEGINALPLDHVLSHPLLFAAYPGLRAIMVTVDRSLGNGARLATREDGSWVITLGPGYQLRALLHEIQHAIQEIEGFAMGGSPERFKIMKRQSLPLEVLNGAIAVRHAASQAAMEVKQFRLHAPRFLRELPSRAWAEAEKETLESLNRQMEEALLATTPTESYSRLAGEVEARNVERRAGLSPQQRIDIAPWDTADRAAAEQLIIMRGG